MNWSGPRKIGIPSPPYKGTGKKLTEKGKKLKKKAQSKKLNLSPLERECIKRYTSWNSSDTNYFLRKGGKEKFAEHYKYHKRTIETLDKITIKNRLQENKILYRNIRFTQSEKRDFLKRIKVGAIITDKGFISTCKNKKLFYDIFVSASIGEVALEIKTKKGQMGIELKNLSAFPHEKEVLLPRNSKFKVTKIKQVKEKSVIELELLEK